jgi:hypothetical protein
MLGCKNIKMAMLSIFEIQLIAYVRISLSNRRRLWVAQSSPQKRWHLSPLLRKGEAEGKCEKGDCGVL